MTAYEQSEWEQLYDLLYADYSEDIPYYLQAAGREGGPVLELGCGTGRISLLLAEHGYDVVGVDVSAPLLSRLRQRLVEKKFKRIRIQPQDMVNLALETCFPLAIIPFRAFLHITEQQSQLRALKSIREHLLPGGLLCFNVFMPDYEYMVRTNRLPYLKKRFRFNTEEIMWEIVSEYNFVTQRTNSVNLIRRFDASGILTQSYALPHALRWLTVSELQLMLDLAGYGSVSFFGGFDRSPISSNSTEIICEARNNRHGI